MTPTQAQIDFGTPTDEIERAAHGWLTENLCLEGESVMHSLADLIRGFALKRLMQTPAPWDTTTKAQIEAADMIDGFLNELEYQKQTNPNATATAALQWAHDEIVRLRATSGEAAITAAALVGKNPVNLLWPPEDMIELLNFLALSADKQETSYGETAWIARHAAKTIAALTAAEQAGDDIDWNADARRLSGCLLAIHGAKTASASALRSVAYDAALNCIMPDVAEFQCDHRTAAAQVGGPSETEAQAIMAEAAALAEVEELKDKLAATIERCAQVAKANVTGEEAAEDILALKD